MPRLARPTVVALAALLATGCFRPIFPGSERIFGATPPRKSSQPSLGLAKKTVTGKEDPHTLIAIDGSRCTVTEQRFKEIAHGDEVWCAWQGGKGS